MPSPVPTKSVVATSEPLTGPGGNPNLEQVAVGEVVRYRLVATLPQGTADAFRFADTLPAQLEFIPGTARLAFVADGGASAITSSVAAVGNAGGNIASVGSPTFLLPASQVTANGNALTFDLGNLTNTDSDPFTESVVIEYNAVVRNAAGNVSGTTLANAFQVSTATTSAASPPVTVRVVEPTIAAVTKNVVDINGTVVATPTGQAGDTMRFRVRYTNTGTGPAYNVRLLDALPAGFALVGGSVAVAGGTGLTDASSAGANQVDVTLASAAAGETVTITYSATLTTAVTPGQQIANTANVTYSTLPGTNGTPGNPTGSQAPGAPGSTDGERVEPPVSGSTTTTVLSPPTLTKVVGSTSLAGTTAGAFTPGVTDAAVGEQVTYQVSFPLTRGTYPRLRLSDTLPAGLTLVSSRIASLGGNITNSPLAVGAAGTVAGQTVTFDLDGTVDNPGPAGGDTVAFEVVALVADVPGNVAGTTLTNNASADFGAGPIAASVPVEVVTPQLQVTKSVLNATAAVDAGTQVTYRLVIQHAAGSSGPAYNISVADALASIGIALNPASVTVAAPGYASVVNTSNAAGLNVGVSELRPGDTIAILYIGTVNGPAGGGTVPAPGSTVTNTAGVTYTSAPTNGRPGGPIADTANVTVNSNAVSGFVYVDANDDGVRQAGEAAVTGGVSIALTGRDAQGNRVSLTTATDATTGAYSFTGLRPGTYALTETQPAGFASGRNTPGSTFGGTGANPPASVIATLVIPAGSNAAGTEYDFGELTPASIGGFVYVDANNDGVRQAGEAAIPNVAVALTGTDAFGNGVSQAATTDGTGAYSFANLAPGTYAVTETQPPQWADGTTSAGTVNGTTDGTAGTNVVSGVILAPGENGVDYDFGEVGGSASGTVYVDLNRDGVKQAAEPALTGVTLTLTGTDSAGAAVSRTATTDVNGLYSFANLPASNGAGYTITETQPLGYGDSPNTPATVRTLNLAAGAVATGLDYGETVGSLAGSVYVDANNDGVHQPGETGIAGTTVALTGKDATGTAVNRTAVTDASGNYTFANLLAPDAAGYAVTESQPAAWADGKTAAGTVNGTAVGTAGDNVVSAVALPAGADGVAYNFGELGAAVAGTVYVDLNRDGTQQAGEAGIAGVTLTLTGTDINGNAVSLTATTDANGHYSFANLPAANAAGYTITETQPAGYGNSPGTPATVRTVAVPAGGAVIGQDFGETAGSLAGSVYVDANNNGVRDSGEAGIPNATVTLSGLDAGGIVVNRTATTDANGAYSFADVLAAGPAGYALALTQPAAWVEGVEAVGTVNGVPLGTPGNNVIAAVALPAGADGVAYDFGERGAALTGTVFLDRNRNGTPDAGEPGLVGVALTLAGTDAAGNPVNRAATTDINGHYTFANLPGSNAAGDTIAETQPAGYGNSPGTPATVRTAAVETGATVTGQNFGETLGSLAGSVYVDANNDAVRDPNEVGIAGTTLTLTGTDATGAAVRRTTTADATGRYTFADLLASGAGNYAIAETQPAGFLQGRNAVGTINGTPVGTPGNDTFAAIALPAGTAGVAYNFGERAPAGAFLSGSAFVDANRDGALQTGEAGVGGVALTLRNSAGTVVGTTATNPDGTYAFTGLAAGTYTVAEDKPGAYGNSTPATLTATVPAAGLANQNFGLTTGSLAGRAYFDANANGVRDAGDSPIPATLVTLTGTDATGAAVNRTAATDAAGAYAFAGLLTGVYRVDETQPASYNEGTNAVGSAGGTLFPPNAVAQIPLGAGVQAVDYDFGETGTAVGGTVFLDANRDGTLDASEKGIPAVTVRLVAPDGTVVATAAADPTGNYTFKNVPAGNSSIVQVQPFGYGNSTPASLSATVPLAGLTNQNFGDTLGSIAGSVYVDANGNGKPDAGEPPIPGTLVTLTGTDIAGKAVTATATTDAAGHFVLDGLLAGTYAVTETQPAGYAQGTNAAGTSGGTVAGDAISGVGLAAGVAATGYLFGERSPTSPGTSYVAGTAFVDVNRDGTENAGDFGLGNVTVQLFDAAGNPASTPITTDPATGQYVFPFVPPGTYSVRETQPAGYGTSTPTSLSAVVPPTLDPQLNRDFGLTVGTLAGTVYVDGNGNGTPDAGEPPIPGTVVTLTGTDAAGAAVNRTATTDATGNYLFENLLAAGAGGYRLTETQPAGFAQGKTTAGTVNGTTVGTVAGDAISDITLGGGQDGVAYDYGEAPAVVSGKVFADANRNGKFDAGEAGLGGATLLLLDATGKVAATTTSNPDGTYTFPGVAPGSDTIRQVPPAGYGTSTPTGLAVTVPVGGLTNQNFGDTLGSLAGQVYVDANRNGVRDAGERPLIGVAVTLAGTDVNGAAVSRTATTDATGAYLFNGLLAGDYAVSEPAQPGDTHGQDRIGSAGGVCATNGTTQVLANVPVGSGVRAAGYDFAELTNSLAGAVYVDFNDDGARQATEKGLAGVTVALTGTDAAGRAVSRTTTTDATGAYSFTDVADANAAGYALTETPPANSGSGKDSAGTAGGTVGPAGRIAAIHLTGAAAATGYLFAETQSDLAVTKTIDKPTPRLNDFVTFTVTVRNLGGTRATGVVITDVLPVAGFHSITIAPSAGTSYDIATGLWTVGGLDVGAAATLVVRGQLTDTNAKTNAARVSASNMFDPNPANDAASVTVRAGLADVQLFKLVDKTNATWFDTITYTFIVNNLGPGPAHSVVVADPFPAGLQYVATVGATQGTFDPTTGNWTVGTLRDGQQARLAVTFRVRRTGALVNTASVRADEIDPDLSNNAGTAGVNVVAGTAGVSKQNFFGSALLRR